jgi:acyl-CoA synthetase (NDP forming)
MNRTVLDLEPFFTPGSIAIVGVPREANRFGGMSFLAYLQDSGFPGKIYPINPGAQELRGLKAYPSVSSLPEVPDLAIVSVPAAHVPAVLEECVVRGLRHIHIVSSGFRETGSREGDLLEERVGAISRRHGLLIIGPNCMGPYCPSSRLTAWGAIPGISGPLGIISQSGGITQRLTEYACSLGVGVEKAVSFGNGTVLDSPDYLAFMGNDKRVSLIAMYLESVRDARRLMTLAKEINREKPIVLLKGGETEAGIRTVASHTGTMAGEAMLWEGFAHQTGMTLVRSLDEWMDAVLALCRLPVTMGKGVFLIGGGGGNSVLNGDACIREGLHVPPLSPATMKRLREIVPVAGSIAGNPLDFWPSFHHPALLAEILELAYADPAVHMVIVDRIIPRKIYHTPVGPDPTPAILQFFEKHGQTKPTVFMVDSDGGDVELARKGASLRAQLCRAGIPAYPTLGRAVRALAHLHRYHSRSVG